MDVEVRKINALLKILSDLGPVARLRVLDFVRARVLDEMPRVDSATQANPVRELEVTCVECP